MIEGWPLNQHAIFKGGREEGRGLRLSTRKILANIFLWYSGSSPSTAVLSISLNHIGSRILQLSQ